MSSKNDNARDLCSGEIVQLAEKIEAALSREGVAFDDIEGPLLYVHMLSCIAEGWESKTINRTTVERWKKTYLDAFNSTIGSADEDYLVGRRDVIAREFDSLIAKLPEIEIAPKSPAKKAKKKAKR